MINIVPYYPWILAHPPVIPKLYYGAISIEQRALEIAKRIHGIEEYLHYLSEQVQGLEDDIKAYVDEIIDDFEDEINDEMAALESDLRNQIQDLREWVESQTFSMEQWDVTRGMTDHSVEVMRRLFFDVTTDGATVDDLATSTKYETVDALATSGWNCRALAVIGATVLDISKPEQWQAA